MQRVATLKDVAELAGVSVATVSRVINGHANVSSKTRALVENAILQLNYSPNTIARSLVTGRTGTILLFIVQEDPIVPSTWAYELPIIQGIYDYLKIRSWDLQIAMCSYREFQKTGFLSRHLSTKNFAGILIMSAWLVERHIVSELKKRNLPYLIIGAHDPDHKSLTITFDNAGAVKDLVKHLSASGSQLFGLIGGARNQLHMQARTQGMLSALRENGLPVSNRLIRFGEWSVESGYRLMKELLAANPRPTAFVCGNDNIAVGAIKAISESGLAVPRDIAVVGFDDNIVAQVVSPTLTTVRIPLRKMGMLAAERLVQEFSQPDEENRQVVLPCELVIRESSSIMKTLTHVNCITIGRFYSGNQPDQ